MIQVRYVHPSRLLTKQQTECLTSRYVPVIPLADLTALVEGLRKINTLAVHNHTDAFDPMRWLIEIAEESGRSWRSTRLRFERKEMGHD